MLNEVEQFALTKSGHQVLQLGLSRSSKGLVIRAKAHSSIEDFFQTLSLGSTQPVSLHGRFWRPIRAEEPLPPVYQLDQAITAPFNDGRNSYTLNRAGQDLLVTGAAPNPFTPDSEADAPTEVPSLRGQCINISFLRLRGISEGDGITFSIPSVQTAEAIRGSAKLLRSAVKQFYVDFLKPIEVVITMSTQEVR